MLEKEINPAEYLDEGRWKALANEIGKPLPRAVAQEICFALVMYEMTCLTSGPPTKDRATLKKIVTYAAKLKNALEQLSPAIYFTLDDDSWSEKVVRLSSAAQRTLEAMPHGRPPEKAREDLIFRIANIYVDATDRHASVSRNPSTGRVGGPFYRFAKIILETQSIDPACIRPAIEKRNKQIAADENLS